MTKEEAIIYVRLLVKRENMKWTPNEYDAVRMLIAIAEGKERKHEKA